jgi:membrane protease YdiL (CAAX protease family)
MKWLWELEQRPMAARTIETRIFLLCVVALLISEVVVSLVPSESAYVPMPILGPARAAETLLIVMIVSIWGKGMASIGLAPQQILGGVKKGLIWSTAFGMLTLLGFAVLYVANTNPLGLIRTELPSSAGETILFFLVGGLVAPIAEEAFFRGIVYGFLRRWGVLVALVGSTVVFVLPHIRANVPVTQIVGGIVFAVAYETTGNLMVPITIHVLGNTAIFALSLVS